MTTLDRAAILAAQDIAQEHVSVPEWGGTVIVKAMSGLERNEFSKLTLNEKREFDATRYHAALAIVSCVDEHGAPIFSAEDMGALQRKSAAALERVGAAAERLSGIGAAAQETARGN